MYNYNYTQQNTPSQVNQARPRGISDRDFVHLKEALISQMHCARKAATGARGCQDSQIRTSMEQASQLHQQQFEMLYQRLQSEGQSHQSTFQGGI